MNGLTTRGSRHTAPEETTPGSDVQVYRLHDICMQSRVTTDDERQKVKSIRPNACTSGHLYESSLYAVRGVHLVPAKSDWCVGYMGYMGYMGYRQTACHLFASCLRVVCESLNATLCRSSPPPRPSSLLHHQQQSHHQQIKFYEDFFLRFLKNHKNFHYTGKHQQTIDIKLNIATDLLVLWIGGRSLSFEGFIEVVVGRFSIEILSN